MVERELDGDVSEERGSVVTPLDRIQPQMYIQ